MSNSIKKTWRPIHSNILIGLLVLLASYAGLRHYYMDSFTLSGYRISKINSGVLNNGDTSLPTSLSVYNAIAAAAFDPAAGLSGWVDITNPAYGGVADGGYTSGTDNTPALNAAIAAAVNNGVVYIPPGSYRFLTGITWPTAKRVFLVSYGDLYFGTNTAFLIDGNYVKMWLNGALYGTNQFGGTINYGSQTNAGIYLRNAYNCEIWTNTISGFKYGMKVGGNGGGNQYNKLGFNRLWVNSVGIQLVADGTTANGPRWSNENTYNGSQITADTGIVFQKDDTPGDRFNGNKFYNIGFEYRGNNLPMRVALKGDWATNNQFIGGRIENAGVTTKFQCTADFNTVQFIGWYMQDTWLNNLGYGAMVTGDIYSTSGDLLGNQAFGYPYSSSNTYLNGRFRIKGLRWGFSSTAALGSNIDVTFEVDNDAFTSASTYTVGVGINWVKVNYTGGTNTTTLPDATTRSNEIITVKNLHATNSVTVVGPQAGSIVSIPGYGAVSYASDGNVWYDVATRITYSGGGGSSQWTTTGSNIYYLSGAAIGVNPGVTNFSWLTMGGSTTGTAIIEVPGTSTYVSVPRNGQIDYNGVDWRATSQGMSQKILTDYNSATLINKTWQGTPIAIGYWSTATGLAGQIPVVNSTATQMSYRYSKGGLVTITAATYTVHDTVEMVIGNKSSGTLAITMPAAASYYGREISFRNINAVSNITFSPTDPASTATIAAGQGGVTFQSNGTSWYLKNKWHD